MRIPPVDHVSFRVSALRSQRWDVLARALDHASSTKEGDPEVQGFHVQVGDLPRQFIPLTEIVGRIRKLIEGMPDETMIRIGNGRYFTEKGSLS